ncbi:MAG: biopolymer transporter ExbD [Planctomycetota bacterium]
MFAQNQYGNSNEPVNLPYQAYGLSRRSSSKDEVEMTSMVDVTFLLLIFFMVTAAFQLQKAIAMPRQTSELPSERSIQDPDPISRVDIQIDESDGLLVITDDWEHVAFGKQDLITILREAITASDSDSRLTINVHDLATLNALVESLDAGTIVGFEEIRISHWSD